MEFVAAQRPPAVVFDVGGVLIDWDPRYLYRQLLPDEEAVERFLAEVCTPEWNREQDRGRSWDEAVAQLSGRFPTHAPLIAAYRTRWLEMVSGEVAETVALLAALHEQQVPLYALTNFSTEKFAEIRARFGFFDWFRGIVVSGQEQLIKPDPRLYRVLLERYSLDPVRTVFVDDRGDNIAAARSLGMTGLHFTDPTGLRAGLLGLGLLEDGQVRS